MILKLGKEIKNNTILVKYLKFNSMHPGYFDKLQIAHHLNNEATDLQGSSGITSEFTARTENFYQHRMFRELNMFLKFKDNSLNSEESQRVDYWARQIFAYTSHLAQPELCFYFSEKVVESILEERINPFHNDHKIAVVYNLLKTHSWIEIISNKPLQYFEKNRYIDSERLIIDFTGIHPSNNTIIREAKEYSPYFGKPSNAPTRHQSAYLDHNLFIVYGISDDFSIGYQIQSSTVYPATIDWEDHQYSHLVEG